MVLFSDILEGFESTLEWHFWIDRKVRNLLHAFLEEGVLGVWRENFRGVDMDEVLDEMDEQGMGDEEI